MYCPLTLRMQRTSKIKTSTSLQHCQIYILGGKRQIAPTRLQRTNQPRRSNSFRSRPPRRTHTTPRKNEKAGVIKTRATDVLFSILHEDKWIHGLCSLWQQRYTYMVGIYTQDNTFRSYLYKQPPYNSHFPTPLPQSTINQTTSNMDNIQSACTVP